ncbi:MAG: dihydroorotate dehydrogenase electron transfer subunit [Desulfatiglandales bacterium]
MKDGMAVVLSNREVSRDLFLLRLWVPFQMRESKPGQFVMLKVGTSHDPLLRRPFSLYKVREREVEILFKVRGKATSMMRNLRDGDTVSLMGPLGNGFRPWREGETPLLVAGGIGLAGIGPLAEMLPEEGFLVAGFRTGDEAPLELIRKRNSIITSEDGSLGIKGTVIDGIEILLREVGRRKFSLFACGSRGMLKAVSLFARSHSADCQLLLESYMACGVGACQGCVILTHSGYKRVCRDGPVFSADQIVW